MNRRSNEDGMDKFQKLPFCVLVKKDKDLLGIRSEYALKSKSERNSAKITLRAKNGVSWANPHL